MLTATRTIVRERMRLARDEGEDEVILVDAQAQSAKEWVCVRYPWHVSSTINLT
jgi:hypothetical protein